MKVCLILKNWLQRQGVGKDVRVLRDCQVLETVIVRDGCPYITLPFGDCLIKACSEDEIILDHLPLYD